MISITTNENNANKNRLEKNEPLKLCVTMDANDIKKLIIGGFAIIVMVGLVVL